MKIAVVGTRGFPNVQGGVENHCENLYVHLAQKGCDITVFTRKHYVDARLKSYKGISLIPLTCSKNKFLEAFTHTLRSVIRAKKVQPDLIHIHSIGPSFFSMLAKFLGMRVVVTHHGPDYMRKKWPLPAKIYLRLCEWAGMTFSDEIIAISGNIAEDIKKKFGRKAVVIPNGVDIPEILPDGEILERYGLQYRKYILAVGRFVPEKGFDCLIDAFNSGNFAGWKLVIAGSADHEDAYSTELKGKASRNSGIVLTGFLTGRPLQELFSCAGLFVLPSYYEGLPIALLEAMSYGLSCIASDIPANRNVELTDNRFFKPGDAELLSSKMKEHLHKDRGDDEMRRQIEIIHEKYNWEKIAGETLKIYNQVIS